ncbi:unnamed protein product [Sphagnum troendelagicum]
MVVHKTTRRQDVRHWTAGAGQQYNDANSDVRTDVDRTSTANDLGVASLQIVLLRCCTCCCDAVARVGATLRHCKLRHSKLRCCYVASYDTVALQRCGAAALQLALLWRVARYNAARGCNAMTL